MWVRACPFSVWLCFPQFSSRRVLSVTGIKSIIRAVAERVEDSDSSYRLRLYASAPDEGFEFTPLFAVPLSDAVPCTRTYTCPAGIVRFRVQKRLHWHHPLSCYFPPPLVFLHMKKHCRGHKVGRRTGHLDKNQ